MRVLSKGPVGDHLDEADGNEDRKHAAAGSGTPGLEGELVVELRAGEADDLLHSREGEGQGDGEIHQ